MLIFRAFNVYVPKDRVTNLHQGYGFVEFQSEKDADHVSFFVFSTCSVASCSLVEFYVVDYEVSCFDCCAGNQGA